MQFSDQNMTFYAIKTNGSVTGRYSNQILAEHAKSTLPENVRNNAVVVPVDSSGRELLNG